jgi:hypothetical protein
MAATSLEEEVIYNNDLTFILVASNSLNANELDLVLRVTNTELIG